MNTSITRSKSITWTGRIIMIIVILFLAVDGAMKVVRARQSMDASIALGIAANFVPILGFVLLICTLLYAIPRTALLGAVLLTAYLGGAVAVMLLAKQPFYFPIVFAIFSWVGVYFSGVKLKSLL